eukprot:c28073_g3_i2 orf=811-2310(-)
MDCPCSIFFSLFVLVACAAAAITATRLQALEDRLIVLASEASPVLTTADDEIPTGTRWAILVAGSKGYGNYRHQADVCHAYQILRRGGLKDENIVVFMYDDIAYHPSNPYPGVIINSPYGADVYAGVPKDYTGKDVTVGNLLAVLLGNKTAITGGSGKVVDSNPNDHIFIFYTDHGGPGVLGMPNHPYLFAIDIIQALKEKHLAGTYKEMVIYVEACESGSIFEGLLPDDLNIYVTTASNAVEDSWGTYCPGMDPSPPPEYYTCLGDLYSVSWMEDSEVHNTKDETLKDQYDNVKARTSNHDTYFSGSHVMQYGNIKMDREELYTYMGFDPANENISTGSENQLLSSSLSPGFRIFLTGKKSVGINQHDADLLYLWQKYEMANEGSSEKVDARLELVEEMSHRLHLDRSIDLLGKLLFGFEQGPTVLKAVRPLGQPLVDDWACLKTMVNSFQFHCGSLSQYGMKHMRAFANICNAGVDEHILAVKCAEVCERNGYMSGA